MFNPDHTSSKRQRAGKSRALSLFASALLSTAAPLESLHAAPVLPFGGQFVAGAGAIASTSNKTQINQSTARAVIDWQNFSIGQGGTVQINNGTGATLNRVTGGNVSNIAGSLNATGSVYVVNQAGIVVAPGGKVVTGGDFVASTRDIPDNSFMSGSTITANGTSFGTVVNQGTIQSANGNVTLIGKSVTNDGQISAHNGAATLAAGDDVDLSVSIPGSGEQQQINVKEGSGNVTNSGMITAAQAKLDAVGGNVYSLAANNGGIIRATGTTTMAGHVYLTAGGDVQIGGTIAATNADGSGGTVTATGGKAGKLTVTGTVNARATNPRKSGGNITLTASHVGITGTANIKADGGVKGGTILIGGDRHGGSDASLNLSSTPVTNAETTTIDAGAEISADGGEAGATPGRGDGGNVVVWSDQQTIFQGAIFARGGDLGGNGGFVETSGEQLSFLGSVNTNAPRGTTGMLLLDPADVTINNSATTGDTDTSNTYSPNSGVSSANILNTDLQTALASNNITVTTANSGTSGGGTGNITVATPITWTSGHSLTLTAANNITVNGSSAITSTGANGGAGVAGTAGGAIAMTASGSITIGSSITANGGTGGAGAIGNPGQAGGLGGAGGNITLSGTSVSVASGIAIAANGGNGGNGGNGQPAVKPGGNGGNGGNGGTISFTATSGNISLASITSTAGSGGTGGTSSNTPGNPGSAGSIGSISASATSGSITVTADSLSQGTVTLTANSSTGTVTIQPATATTVMTLSGAGALNLTAANLAHITANTLVLGSSTATGGLTVTASASAPSTVTNLSLINSAVTIPAAVTLTDAANNGTITVQANTLTFSNTSTSLVEETGTSSSVIVEPITASTTMSLAGSATLNLPSTVFTNSEITAGTLQFGNISDTGGLTVGATVSLPASITNLSLINSTIAVGSGFTLTDGNASGDITLQADTLSFGSITSLIKSNGTSGIVTILPVTASRAVNIGGTSDPGSDLYVSTASLGQLTATTLNVGSISDTELLTVNAALSSASALAHVSNLDLLSGSGGISVANAITMPASGVLTLDSTSTTAGVTQAAAITPVSGTMSLALAGSGNFTLTNSGNSIANVSGSVGSLSLTDGAALTVTASNLSSTGASGITLTDSNGNGITLTGALSSGGAGPVTLTADTMSLGNTVTATGQTVTLQPNTVSRAVNVGGTSDPGSDLYLSTANLNEITAGTLAAGNTSDTGLLTINAALATTAGAALQHVSNLSLLAGSGGISITNPITMPAAGVLTLNSTSTTTGVTQAAAIMPVSGAMSIALAGGGNFTLTNSGNSIANVSGSVGSLSLTDSAALTVTGSNLSSTGSSGITLTDSNSSGITLTGTLSTGFSGPVSLIADSVALNNTLSGGGQTVQIRPYTSTATMSLAGSSTLNLSQTALNEITASTFIFGSNTQASGAMTVGGAIALSATGITNLKLLTGGAITINSSSSITGASSSIITLASGTSFTNNGGSGALAVSGGGRWLVYSQNPASDNRGSLAYNFKQYATDYPTAPTPASGNGFLYHLAPTITASLQGTVSKTYDGTTTATLASGNYTFSGAVDGDTITLNNPASGTYNTKDVAAGKTVSVTGVAISSAVNGAATVYGYALASSSISGAVGTINPLAVTLTGTRSYDATTNAPAAILSVSNVLSGDNVTVASGTGTLASKDQGSRAITSFGTLALGNNAAGDYTLTGASGSVTINPLAVTLTGTRNYDATTNAPAAILSVSNVLSGDNVTVASGTGTLASQDQGSRAITSFGTLALGNNAAGDYMLTGASGSVTINPLAVTLSGTRSYDATTNAAAGILTISNIQGSDNVTVASGTGTLASKDQGSRAITGFGTLVLGNNAAGDYTLTGASGSVTITAKALTELGSLAANNKIYDATTTATLTGSAALLSFEAAGSGSTADDKPYTGDTVSVTGTAAGTFASKDVANGITVNISGLSLTGAQAGDYSLVAPSTTANITAKALTALGSLAANNKIYDATTTATLTGSAALLSSEAAGSGSTADDKSYTGDTVSVTGTAAGTFASKDVANGITVNISGLSLTGAQAGDYSLVAPSTTANITAKALTALGTLGAANKVYNATTTATLTGSAALLSSEAAGSGSTADDKSYTGDTVSVTGTAAGTFASKDVANGITVNISGLSLTGAQAGDYSLVAPSTTANITAKALTELGSLAANNKIYDATTTATLTGSAALLSFEAAGSGSTADDKPYTGDTVSVTGTAAGTFASKDVANGITVNISGLSLTGAQAGDYSLVAPSTTANITAKALTALGSLAANNKIYDATTTATLTGSAALLSSEAAGSGSTADDKSYTGDTVSVTGTAAGTFASKDVANGITVNISGLSLTGAQAGDYSLVAPSTTANITAKALTALGTLGAANKVYNATTTATLTGSAALLSSEAAGSGSTADDKSYTGDTVSVTGTAAGTFASKDVANGITVNISGLSLTGAQAGDYSLVAPSTIANITPLAVTLSGTRSYDATTNAAAGILTISNIQGSDNVTVASGTGTLASQDQGSRAITGFGTLALGNNAAGDYTLTGASGSVTINPLAVTLTGTRVYDATTNAPAAILSVSNVLSGDNVTVAAGTGTLASQDQGSRAITSFGTLALGNNAAGDYTLTGASGSVTINPLAVTLTGTRNYDATTNAPAAILSVSNVLSGDNVTVASGTGTLASQDQGSRAITGFGTLALGNNAAGDYTLTGASGSVTINPLAVTLSGTRSYDATTNAAAGILTISNIQGSDNVTVASGTGTLASKDQGSRAITGFGTLALGDNAAGDYTLTGASGSVTINPLAVTLSGTRSYDATTNAAAGILTISNIQGSDNVTVASGTGTLASQDQGSRAITSFGTLALGNNAAGDYMLTGASGSVTITPLAVTLSGTRSYDATTNAAAGILLVSNVQSGDNVTVASGTATLASQDQGSRAITGFGTLALGNNTAGDYTLTGASGSVVINPLVVTLTGTRSYDATTNAAAGILSVNNVQSSDNVTVASGSGTLAAKDQGNQTITSFGTLALGNNAAGDYTLTGASGSVTINPLAVTLTGTRNYDATTNAPAAILSVSNIQGSDNVTVASGTGTLASKDQGNQAIASFGTLALGNNAAGDYTLTGASGSVTINPLAVTLSGTRSYDATTNAAAGILTISNIQGSDNVTVASGTGTLASQDQGSRAITGFGTLALGNNAAGDYTLTGASGSVTINPLAVTLTGTRSYDATTNAPASILTISNVQGSDNVTVAAGTGTLASQDQGSRAITSFGTLALGNNAAGDYTLTGASGSVTINPLAVTLTGTRNYDATTNAPAAILSVSNVLSGDNVTVASGTGTLASQDQGSRAITGFGTLALGNNAAGDYTLTGASGSVTINPLAVTLTGTRSYDATTNAPASILAISNVQGSDNVTVASGTGTLASKDQGSRAITGFGTLALGNNAAGDYTLTGASGLVTINPLAVTLTGTRSYDATTNAPASILTISNVQGSDNLTVASGTGTLASQDQGSRAITGFGTLALGNNAAGDYTLTGASGSVTINPLPVTLTGTRVYDATTNATAAILSVSNVLSGDNVTVASGTGTLASQDQGSRAITGFGTLALGNNAAGDYTLIGASGSVTITPLAVTLTGTRSYDATTNATAGILTVSNVQGSDNVTVASGTATLASQDQGSQAITSFGTLALGNNAAGDYTLTGASGSVTINPLPVTLTGTRVYDATTNAPAAILSVSNVLSGDNVTVASGTGTLASQDQGSRAITGFGTLALGNNAAGDYTLAGASGSVTINPLPVTLTGTRNYDATTNSPAAILSVSNVLSGDNVTVASGAGTLASKDQGSRAITGFGTLALGNNAAGDYTLTGALGSVTINPLPVTLTGTRVYDATTNAPAAILSVSNVLSGDNVTVASGTGTLASQDQGSRAITGFGTLALGNNAAGDYTLTGASGSVTINPLPVTLTGTRNYDATTNAPAAILSVSNVLSGDNVTVASGTGTLASQDQGSRAITGFGTLALGNNAAGDYTLTGASGSVTINPLAVTLTGTRNYDATTNSPAAILSVSNVLSGDNVTVASGTGTLASQDQGSRAITSFGTLALGNNAAGDYTLTGASGSVTINPLPVTLTGTRNYDATTNAAAGILTVSNNLDGGNMTLSGIGVLASKNTGSEPLTLTAGALTGLSLSGIAAGNYTLSGGSGTVTITQALLTIAAVTDTKTYDATTTSSATPSVTGLLAGDSVSGVAQIFDSANAGSRTLSVSAFTVNDGNSGGNYSVTSSGTASGTITAKSLTVSGLTATDRAYDGTLTGPLSGSPSLVAAEAAGVGTAGDGKPYLGDDISIAGTASGAFADKDVGTAKTVTVSSLSTSGASAGNYTLSMPALSADITSRVVLLSGSRIYDGTTDAQAANLTITNNVDGGNLTLTGKGDLASAIVGVQPFASTGTLALSGSEAGNYTLTGITGNGSAMTIDAAAITVTISGSKIYDGTTLAPASILNVTNNVDGNNLVLSGTATLANKDVGSQALLSSGGVLTGLTLSGSAAINYTLTGGTGTVTITPLAVTLSGTRSYDATTNAAAGILLVSNVQSGDNVTVASGTATLASQDQGSRAITGFGTLALGNNTAGDYTLTGASGSVVINPLVVTLTGTRSYDATTNAAAGILSVNNVQSSDNVTVASGSGTLAAKDQGNQTITSFGTLALGNNAAGDYTLTGASGSVTINPLAVTLTGTRNYDATTNAPAAILSVSNIQGSDNVTVASGTGTLASKDQGNQAIASFGTLALGNNAAGDYTLTGASGSVTINPLAVTLSGTRSYDATTNAAAGILTISNIQGSDNVTVASGTGTLASQDQGSRAITGFGTLALGNNAAGDYTLTGASGSVTINPLAVTLTGTRSYDATTNAPASILTISNVQGSDNVTVAAGTGTLASQDQGSRAITSFGTLALGNNAAGDYTLTGASGSVTINPLAVTLTGTRNYDATTNAPAAILSVSNVLSGDNVTVASGTGTLASQDQGSRAITGFGTLALGNNAAGDYTLTGASGSVTINPLAVTLTGTRSYDATTNAPASILAISNVQGSDNVTVASGTGTLASKDQGSRAITGFGTLALGNNAAGDYTLTGASGLVTINPLAVTLTGTRSYDATTNAPASILTISNVQGSDNLTVASGTGTLASQDQGSRAITGFGTLALGNNAAGDYTLTGALGSVTINPLPVTLTGTRVYDATTNATAGILAVSNVQGSDNVTVTSGTGTLTSKDRGNQAITSFGTLALGNNAAGDYTLAGSSGSVTIAPLPVILSGNRHYDGTPNANGSTLTITNNLDGGNLTLSGTGTLAGSAVGSQPFTSANSLTLGGSASGNYTLSEITANGSGVTIVPAIVAVTITGSKVYDGTPAAPASLLTVTDIVPGDDVLLTGTGTLAGKDVGAQNLLSSGGSLVGLSLTGTSASDYTLSGGSGTVTITPKALALASGVTANNRIYDGTTNATLSFSSPSLSGIVSGDAVIVDTSSNYSANFSDKDASAGKTVTVSGLGLAGSDAGNYTLIQPAGLAANIAPAALSITPNDQHKAYGQALSFNGTEFSASGLAAGDTITSVSLTSVGAVAAANAGTYSVTASVATGSFAPSNYMVAYGTGVLTVNPLPVLLTGTMPWNQAVMVPASVLSISNLVPGADATLTGSALLSGYSVGQHSFASLSNLVLSGASAGNYTLIGGSGMVIITPTAPPPTVVSGDQPEVTLAQFAATVAAQTQTAGITVPLLSLNPSSVVDASLAGSALEFPRTRFVMMPGMVGGAAACGGSPRDDLVCEETSSAR